jgi:hypothetical protein
MNSNLIERRAFTASGCFASLRYRTIFCQNYQFATHTVPLNDRAGSDQHHHLQTAWPQSVEQDPEQAVDREQPEPTPLLPAKNMQLMMEREVL